MAHTAYFKFPDLALDVLPDDLEDDLDSASVKSMLVGLFTNEGGAASCGQGKLILLKAGDEIYMPVAQVTALIIAYDAGGDGNHKLIFHLRDVSASFQLEAP